MIERYIKSKYYYAAGGSVVGQVRKANEDNCGYQRTPNGELFVVCDGMGGHVGGATASRIAVDSIISFLSERAFTNKVQALTDAILFANTQILGTAAADPSLKGMGTTACIVLIEGENSWIAHVGDSRIYLYDHKQKKLHRITKDHSFVQALVDKGELDDREAEHHPQKNIILKALGIKQDVMPEVNTTPVRTLVGDTFLICSDGLSGMIDDNEIETILRKKISLEDKVELLISAANAPEKGKDNITVQLIETLQSNSKFNVYPDYNPIWRKQSIHKYSVDKIIFAIIGICFLLFCSMGVITVVKKWDVIKEKIWSKRIEQGEAKRKEAVELLQEITLSMDSILNSYNEIIQKETNIKEITQNLPRTLEELDSLKLSIENVISEAEKSNQEVAIKNKEIDEYFIKLQNLKNEVQKNANEKINSMKNCLSKVETLLVELSAESGDIQGEKGNGTDVDSNPVGGSYAK